VCKIQSLTIKSESKRRQYSSKSNERILLKYSSTGGDAVGVHFAEIFPAWSVPFCSDYLENVFSWGFSSTAMSAHPCPLVAFKIHFLDEVQPERAE